MCLTQHNTWPIEGAQDSTVNVDQATSTWTGTLNMSSFPLCARDRTCVVTPLESGGDKCTCASVLLAGPWLRTKAGRLEDREANLRNEPSTWHVAGTPYQAEKRGTERPPHPSWEIRRGSQASLRLWGHPETLQVERTSRQPFSPFRSQTPQSENPRESPEQVRGGPKAARTAPLPKLIY